LSASFDSPQFGQSTTGPPCEREAWPPPATTPDAGAAAAEPTDEADDADDAGGAAFVDPPIGAPHVSHHSGSPLS
jgi:hypothetical protein